VCSCFASAGGIWVIPVATRWPRPSAIAGSITEVVTLGRASISIGPVTWSRRNGARSLGNRDITEMKVVVAVAGALAGTVLKPGDTVVGTPATHDEATVSREGISHASNVASVLLGNIDVASLCQSELVRCLAKFDLDMERLM
jgi:hypothetical protein